MRYKVTIPNPIFFNSLDDVMMLAGIAGPGTIIEMVDDALPKVGRPPRAKPVGAAQPEVQTDLPQTPKRRGRPPKVKPVEAEAKPVEAEAEPVEAEAKPVESAPIDREKVRQAFAALIEVDYDTAAGLLEKFGVNSFSKLPDEKLKDFAAELDKYGK